MASTTATPSAQPVEPAPLYAFNGAYATYTLNDYYNRKITFTISEVNVTAQTFKVSRNYIGDWNVNGQDTGETVSYVNISPIPSNQPNVPFSAAGYADLQMLNNGKIPQDMPVGTTVEPNHRVFTGGQYVNADEIHVPNENGTDRFTVLVDMRSGLTAIEDFNENGAPWGIAYGQLSLISTNIPMTANFTASPSPSPPPSEGSNQILLATGMGVGAAIIVASALLIYFKKAKHQS